MWIMIMYTALAFTGASLVYLSDRVSNFGFIASVGQKNKRIAVGAVIVFLIFIFVGLAINFINAIVCAIYFALAWLVSDSLFWIVRKLRKCSYEHYYAGVVAVLLAAGFLSIGWYLNHNVWKTEYNLLTSKKMPSLKILMFADSHIGTTFNAKGFAKHLADMEKQRPDVVIVAGDFVDDDTTKADMIASCKALGSISTKYGIYFVSGNHDKGYYGAQRRGFSEAELLDELTKNGIKVLRDEKVLIGDAFYIIGRRDLSEEKERRGQRLSMADFVKSLDKDKYIIVADHQPADYDNQAKAEADLVLSGHTHGGQLFPFNYVGKWIGANDAIYGHEKRGNTDFIVTSGISDWSIKFKTGTKSEYVVINVQGK